VKISFLPSGNPEAGQNHLLSHGFFKKILKNFKKYPEHFH
jgi:hypothetical protein